MQNAKIYALPNFRNAEGELTGKIKMPASSLVGTAIGAVAGHFIGKSAKTGRAKKLNAYNGAAIGLLLGSFAEGFRSK